jgi:carbon-monoxide dehydrogenase large subunit
MSRSAIAGGGAIMLAAVEITRRLREDAAEELEASSEDMIVVDGRVHVRGAPGAGLTVGGLVARAAPDRYRVSSSFDPEAVCYAYATHACRVQVDRDTAAVSILRYVVAEDCGRIINPAIVKGQVQGGAAQGIGGALYEQHHYDEDGQLQTASLMDYLMPTAHEIPALEIVHLELPAPGSPTGARGAGEGGAIGPLAAVANAVGDALGIECNELPITPERVWAALRSTPDG